MVVLGGAVSYKRGTHVGDGVCICDPEELGSLSGLLWPPKMTNFAGEEGGGVWYQKIVYLGLRAQYIGFRVEDLGLRAEGMECRLLYHSA